MTHQALYSTLAKYYDRIYAGKDYRSESRELLRIARRAARRPVRKLLDVACGTGRHLEFFRRSLPVEGVDLSPAMLAIAHRRLGRKVGLHQGDMRRFRLPSRFDVIVCLFSAIGYMPTSADRIRAFRNFGRHLAPGGVALIEGWVRPERWRGRIASLQTYSGPEAKIARVSVSRRRRNISWIEMHYLIGEPGKRIVHKTEVHRNPLVATGQMLRELQRAGFRARVLLHGDYRDRGLYVALKPDTK